MAVNLQLVEVLSARMLGEVLGHEAEKEDKSPEKAHEIGSHAAAGEVRLAEN